MIYKLGNITDLTHLPPLDETTYDMLYEFTRVLTDEYGADRDIDHDDGGYVLYAEPGTSSSQLKEGFDYTRHTIEYVNRKDSLCAAMYILHNEYAVVIVMAIADAPVEISHAFEEEYGNAY